MLNINYSDYDDMADPAADVWHPEIYRPGKFSAGKGARFKRPEEMWKPAVNDWVLHDENGSAGVIDLLGHPDFGGR
jgi:hypothetical protein